MHDALTWEEHRDGALTGDARKGHSVEVTPARDMKDKKKNKIIIYVNFKFGSKESKGFEIW